MGSSLSMETATEIRHQLEVGGAGIAPGRMDPWARHASFPDRRETESTAMTRVPNGRSVCLISKLNWFGSFLIFSDPINSCDWTACYDDEVFVRYLKIK